MWQNEATIKLTSVKVKSHLTSNSFFANILTMLERISRNLGITQELPPAIVLGGKLAKARIEMLATQFSAYPTGDNFKIVNSMGFEVRDIFEYTGERVGLTGEPFLQLQVERFEFGTKRINLDNGRYTSNTRLWYVHKHTEQEVTPSLINDLENRKSAALKRFDSQTPEQLAKRFTNFIDSVIYPRIF